MENTKIEVEEINLEDLIVVGEECHTPCLIQFPLPNGEIVKSKALIKQITVRELKKMKISKKDDELEICVKVVERGLLKKDESNFSREELLYLPIGVLRSLANKILELSGINMDEELKNF